MNISHSPIQLGVNIDHVATLRQARGVLFPSPLEAAFVAARSGADFITLHLREDARHIQRSDVQAVKDHLPIGLNLEMALTEEMLDFACLIKPDKVCLVPEKREELTTEGGLALTTNASALRKGIARLNQAGIHTSLFIEPDQTTLDQAFDLEILTVELHTGAYANASPQGQIAKLEAIRQATLYARQKGLNVHLGHGVDYVNVRSLQTIEGVEAFNIGYAIIAQALFVGLDQAISRMKALINGNF